MAVAVSYGVGFRCSLDLVWLWPSKCSSDWTPSLGTSVCRECSPKKPKNNNKKTSKKQKPHSISLSSFHFWPPHGIWGSWARNQIQAAVAAYAEVTATSDPQPTQRHQGLNLQPCGHYLDSFLRRHSGNSRCWALKPGIVPARAQFLTTALL